MFESYHQSGLNQAFPQHFRSPLRRVTRRQPCEVCGKGDWCSIRADGSAAICMRVISDRPTHNGGYLHILRYDDLPAPQRLKPKPPKPKPATERADDERVIAVYADLLRAHLVLSKQHRQQLHARGLDAIGVNGYASVPTVIYGTNVARALAREHDLRGVPGFYLSGGNWRMVDCGIGFFVPVRGVDGRLRGMQVRRDEGEPRYLWFSSAGREGGASSGAPVHYAGAYLLKSTDDVTLTEGALKADVASFLLGAPVIAAAGVSTFGDDFAANLKQQFPNIKTCHIAFDADFRTKSQVKAALERLMRQLVAAGFHAQVRTWNSALGKGIDDYLLHLLHAERRAG